MSLEVRNFIKTLAVALLEVASRFCELSLLPSSLLKKR